MPDYKAAAATLLEAGQRGVWDEVELSRLATATMARLAERAAAQDQLVAAADGAAAAGVEAGAAAGAAAAGLFLEELQAAGIADSHQRRKLRTLQVRT